MGERNAQKSVTEKPMRRYCGRSRYKWKKESGSGKRSNVDSHKYYEPSDSTICREFY
jgi:hypothetical protein